MGLSWSCWNPVLSWAFSSFCHCRHLVSWLFAGWFFLFTVLDGWRISQVDVTFWSKCTLECPIRGSLGSMSGMAFECQWITFVEVDMTSIELCEKSNRRARIYAFYREQSRKMVWESDHLIARYYTWCETSGHVVRRHCMWCEIMQLDCDWSAWSGNY